MTPDKPQYETYFAPGPDGQGVEFGRGDVNNPDSNVQYAFASVPADPARHEAILRNLGAAAGGEPITRDNGAEVLSRAVELADAELARAAADNSTLQ